MKIDMHVHTRFSRDSAMDPKELVESAVDKGLDGIAVTDHNTMEGFRELEKIDHGLKIIPGVEITTDRGELLGLFVEKNIDSNIPREVVEEIKKQDGIVVVPHPFDPLRSFDGWEELEDVDGIEVFNSRCLTSGMNRKALEYYKRSEVVKTGGSDAHSPWEVGKAYVEADAKNLGEFKQKLIDREVVIKGNRGGFMSYIHGNLHKLKKYRS